MKALDIFLECIYKVFYLNGNYFSKYKKPGEIIESLPAEKREVLSHLTSDEVAGHGAVVGAPYYCDEFYSERIEIAKIKKEKIEFDKKLKFIKE